MLFFTLLTTAFGADCGMPEDVDPNDKCNIDPNGYANLDHSSFEGGFQVTVATKATTLDAARKEHGETVGDISFNDVDKRFELDCPQTDGEKTVKVTVSRPKGYTAFGAEWIQMFPKDSWANVTNEYEPFTFNDYGSKIPLREFRPQADHCTDAGTMADKWTTCEEGFTEEDNKDDTLNVFMEVDTAGDYEFKYGTPQLVSEGAIGEKASKWVAHEFKQRLFRVGNPWANCATGSIGESNYGTVGVIIPALYGNPNLKYDTYSDLIYDLAGVSVPTKVVIQAYGVGLDAGDADATPPVAPKWSAFDSWTESDKGLTAANGDVYTTCYRAGNGCPLNHEVCDKKYCNLDRWREIVDDLNAIDNVEVLAHVETYSAPNSAIAPVDQRSADDIKANIQEYKDNIPAVKGYYFNQVNGGKPKVDNVLAVAETDAEGFVVFAGGEPLLDKTALDHAGNPNVWITLADSGDKMGIWTPFSWFSGVAASQWGAIVHSVAKADIETKANAIFDRGYGWVYLHAHASYGKYSADTKDALKVVQDRTGRRLSEEAPRRLEASSAQWSCDDTLYECRPVCFATYGVTVAKVADEQCTDAPMDACSCPCYYDAKWSTCHGDEVACVATMKGEETVVGDLICANRGTPKPEHATLQRMMADCQEESVKHGTFPAATCVENFGATDAPATEAPTTEAPTAAPVVEETNDINIESFAAPAFLAAALFLQA